MVDCERCGNEEAKWEIVLKNEILQKKLQQRIGKDGLKVGDKCKGEMGKLKALLRVTGAGDAMQIKKLEDG